MKNNGPVQAGLFDKLQSEGHERVKLAITDIDGVLRGKVVSLEKFKGIETDGFGFCDVVFGWDCNDAAYDNVKFTGWHTGYPDALAFADPSTLRYIPWDEASPLVLADFNGLAICPRSLLKKIKSRAENLGYRALFSQEFEWFNFAETPASLHAKAYVHPQPLTPGMFGYSILRSSLNAPFFNDLFSLMNRFDVPIEGIHTETGPGVYEAAIRYGDILESADRATLFKTGVKEIAYRHQIMATFMAKWNTALPGCSGHVHQSLWDESMSRNLFYDGADDRKMSKLMQSYIAGQLACLPEILPMLAPAINSYKRLVVGAWAPTTLTWGIDNRTTALRALPGGSKSTRLETRVVGSDSNPYLAMAACLASGLYGIQHNLQLQDVTTGNGYSEKRYGELPANLHDATEKMKKSSVAIELFGEAFVEHFCATREWEWNQFLNAGNEFDTKQVSEWEMRRYFEII